MTSIQSNIEVISNNARRLHDDSVLLCANGRMLSSIILAVFAIEELGKSLIYTWGIRNMAHNRTYPTHLEKQSATFCLLSASEIVSLDPDVFKILLPSFTKAGPLSVQFAHARVGFYDNLRLAATYLDQNPIFPAGAMNLIGEEFVHELHDYFRRADLIKGNKQAMEFASMVFEHDLGRM